MASSDNPSQHNNEDFKLENVFTVKGKVALITGGGSGIGLMATQALAVNGAKVYITGRTQEKLDRVVETYSQGISGEIIQIPGDVTKKEDIAKLVQELSSKEKKLDILINNAGSVIPLPSCTLATYPLHLYSVSSTSFETEASSAEEMKKNLFDSDEANFQDWTDTYQTNVPQIYFTTTALLPLLQAASDGTPGWSATVINITSISGLIKSAQHHFSYNASKAAALHLTRMLANEVAQNGLKIRINSIAPGVFPSEMTAKETGSGANQKSHIPKDKYADKVPARRPGQDRDMASAVLFTATNQYLNGQHVVVDGGYTLAAGL
ncbi:hypothetical protein V5O48_009640 [Marasmius crinis-equi]|uniref:Uncharacterized protein n=1 Tax=Marasmius crinis-equi TaxID=585013 RepID=A0ABR3FAN1_9AGAR